MEAFWYKNPFSISVSMQNNCHTASVQALAVINAIIPDVLIARQERFSTFRSSGRVVI